MEKITRTNTHPIYIFLFVPFFPFSRPKLFSWARLQDLLRELVSSSALHETKLLCGEHEQVTAMVSFTRVLALWRPEFTIWVESPSGARAVGASCLCASLFFENFSAVIIAHSTDHEVFASLRANDRNSK